TRGRIGLTIIGAIAMRIDTRLGGPARTVGTARLVDRRASLADPIACRVAANRLDTEAGFALVVGEAGGREVELGVTETVVAAVGPGRAATVVGARNGAAGSDADERIAGSGPRGFAGP